MGRLRSYIRHKNNEPYTIKAWIIDQCVRCGKFLRKTSGRVQYCPKCARINDREMTMAYKRTKKYGKVVSI